MSATLYAPDTQVVHPDLSVDDVIAHWPRSISVMNDYGLDTCCGGTLSLRRAAREARVRVEVLLEAIESAVPGSVSGG